MARVCVAAEAKAGGRSSSHGATDEAKGDGGGSPRHDDGHKVDGKRDKCGRCEEEEDEGRG
jgi:hypothetical protein